MRVRIHFRILVLFCSSGDGDGEDTKWDCWGEVLEEAEAEVKLGWKKEGPSGEG